MADVASLVLSVDSRPAVTAAAALNQLAAAGRPAELAFTRVENAAKPAVNALANIQRQTGLARHELINLSRQVQDVGVSLASGQSPLLVLVQQGTQVADIFASSKGSVGGFATQLRGLVPPTVLAAGGIVALGAAAYGAFQYWKGFALQLDDTARVMETTTGEAAKLQAAASFKGIGQDDFAAGMKRFATNVYDAQNGMGDLAELFRVNGVQARTFNEYLEGAANLIQRAGSYEQKNQILRAAGLPPTAQWVRLLETGADGLRRATAEAANFGGVANDQLVRKAREFDESWNRAWTNFGLYARSAITDASQVYNTSSIGRALLNGVTAIPGVGPITAAAVRAYNAYNPTTPAQSVAERFPTSREQFQRSGAGGGQTVDERTVRKALSDEQPRIGIMGTLATVQQQVDQQDNATPERAADIKTANVAQSESEHDRNRDRRAA